MVKTDFESLIFSFTSSFGMIMGAGFIFLGMGSSNFLISLLGIITLIFGVFSIMKLISKD